MHSQRRQSTGRLPATSQGSRIINGLLDGQSENVGEVTLLNATTSTVVKSQIFRASTVLILVPLSAAAAAVTWWQAGTGVREITIGHTDPGADLEFNWVAVG